MAMRLLSHFARATLRGLDCCACGRESSANIFLLSYVTGERCLRERHFSLQLLAMSRSLLEIIGHFPDGGISFLSLLLRALPTRIGISLSFLGNSDLGAKLLRARALLGDESRKLIAPRFSCCARTVRRVAGRLCGSDSFLSRWHRNAELSDATLETHQLFTPRIHLSRREGDLDCEPSRHQFRVSLRATTLSRERSDLGLNLADQIVDSRQIDRCL